MAAPLTGDRAALHAVPDAGRVAHVAIVDAGQPYALPVGHARRRADAGARLHRQLELAATLVVALPQAGYSVTISAGPPDDPPEDLDRPVWAAVVPVVETLGTPRPAPTCAHDLPAPEW